MPTRLPKLLAAWRDAERRIAELPSDGPDRAQAEAEVERARAEYQAIFDEILAAGGASTTTDRDGH